ncbi:oligosaccharide flippase family protein [Sodalis sp. RH14]|uniref:oligosaccharide flippase family protein n=1 Tax=unclassified Sodalis (in: enterobacteria) TaxID=2636512 RepID=UPI0039B58801
MNNKTIKIAAIWAAIEALSTSLLSILSIVFLARILRPEDYGQIATAQIIAFILQLLLGLGLTEAVIQKKDISNSHIASALKGSLFLALITFVLSIIVAVFFYYYSHEKTIALILPFEGLGAALNIASTVPTALLLRNLEMSAFTKRTILSRILFFAVAIPLALHNYGVWSITFANLFQVSLATILIFIAGKKYIPALTKYSHKDFVELIKFGFYVMVENLLWIVLSRVFSLLIFTFHGTYALGLFNMASRLTDAILNILNTVISRLALPVFSSVQHDSELLKKSFCKVTEIFNLVSMPAFVGAAFTCSYWTPLVLGEKWNPAIPIIQIICVMNAIMFSRKFVGTAMKAVGESKRFMYLSVISASTTLIAAFVTKDQTLLLTLLAWSILRVIVTVPVGVGLMKRILNININEQFRPIFIPSVSTILMSCVIYLSMNFFNKLLLQPIYSVVFMVIVGTFVYSVSALFFIKRRYGGIRSFF